MTDPKPTGKPAASRRHRANGEGSLYQEKATGRWIGYVWNEEHTKRRRVSAKTKAEALARWQGLQDQVRAGQAAPPQKQTVAVFLEQWLTDIAAGSVRPSTYSGYRGHLGNHVVPQLGHLQVAALTTERVQRRYREMREAGLSPSTIAQVHRILCRALDVAVRWKRARTNPARDAIPYRITKKEFPSLSAAEAQRFLAKAKHGGLYALYLLAMTYGLRRGELLGLRWADVDLAAARLQIRQTVGRVWGQGMLTGEPKSAHSRRQLYLTATVADALRAHLRQQATLRAAVGARWVDQDLVFPNGLGKPIEGSNLVNRSFLPTLEAAGLPRMRFHDLRGTTATLLTGDGTQLTTVRDVLGHAAITTTLDYVRQIPALEKEAALRMERLLFPDL